MDVTDPQAAASAIRASWDVNLLINNAGIARGTGFLSRDSVENARAELEGRTQEEGERSFHPRRRTIEISRTAIVHLRQTVTAADEMERGDPIRQKS